MSLSAMPRVLSAAITLVIAEAASARAAFTVGRLISTPRWRSATSGLRVTVPVPETLIVCSGVVLAVSTAKVDRGVSDGMDVAARNRLTPIPATSSRVRGPGVGMVNVVDIWVELLLGAGGCVAGLARKTAATRERFPGPA